MKIRKANINDTPRICLLLDQLGYPTNSKSLEDKITELINHPDHVIVVAEDEDVEAVMSIHFIPQLGLDGDFAVISYLSVDQNSRSNGIGKQLEEYCVQEAIVRGCERVQVHCSMKRTDAHRFYERQGYIESRKYFSKTIR